MTNDSYDLKEQDFLMLKEQIGMLIKLRQKARYRDSQLSSNNIQINKILKMKYQDYLNLANIITKKLKNIKSDYFEESAELLREKAEYILKKYEELDPKYYKEKKIVYWKRLKKTFKNIIKVVRKKRYTVKDFTLKLSKKEKNKNKFDLEEINNLMFKSSNLSNMSEEKLKLVSDLLKKNLPNFSKNEREIIQNNLEIIEEIFKDMTEVKKRATIVANLQKQVLYARPSMIKTKNTIEMFKQNFIFEKKKKIKNASRKKKEIRKDRLKSMMVKRTPNLLKENTDDFNVYDDYGELLMRIDRGKNAFKKNKRVGFAKSQDIMGKKYNNDYFEKHVKKMKDFSNTRKSIYSKKSILTKKSVFQKNLKNEIYFELDNGERKIDNKKRRKTNFQKKSFDLGGTKKLNKKANRMTKMAQMNAMERELNYRKSTKKNPLRSFLNVFKQDDNEDLDIIDMEMYKNQLNMKKGKKLKVINEDGEIVEELLDNPLTSKRSSLMSLLKDNKSKEDINDQTKKMSFRSFTEKAETDRSKIDESKTDSTKSSKKQILLDFKKKNKIRDKILKSKNKKNVTEQIKDYLCYLNLNQLKGLDSLFTNYKQNKIIKEVFSSKKNGKEKLLKLLTQNPNFEKFPSLISSKKENEKIRPSFLFQPQLKKIMVINQEKHSECFSFYCKVKGHSNVCPLGFNNSKIIEGDQVEEKSIQRMKSNNTKNFKKRSTNYLNFLKSELPKNSVFREKIAIFEKEFERKKTFEREKGLKKSDVSITNPLKDVDLDILNNIIERDSERQFEMSKRRISTSNKNFFEVGGGSKKVISDKNVKTSKRSFSKNSKKSVSSKKIISIKEMKIKKKDSRKSLSERSISNSKKKLSSKKIISNKNLISKKNISRKSSKKSLKKRFSKRELEKKKRKQEEKRMSIKNNILANIKPITKKSIKDTIIKRKDTIIKNREKVMSFEKNDSKVLKFQSEIKKLDEKEKKLLEKIKQISEKEIKQISEKKISEKDIKRISKTEIKKDIKRISKKDLKKISKKDLKKISEKDLKKISEKELKRISVPVNTKKKEGSDVLSFLQQSFSNIDPNSGGFKSDMRSKNDTKNRKKSKNENGGDSNFSYDFKGSGSNSNQSSNIIINNSSNFKGDLAFSKSKNSKEFENHIKNSYKNLISSKNSKKKSKLQKELEKDKRKSSKKNLISSKLSKVKVKNSIKPKVSLNNHNRGTLLTKNETIIADDILSSTENMSKLTALKKNSLNHHNKNDSYFSKIDSVMNKAIEIEEESKGENNSNVNVFDMDIPIPRTKAVSQNIIIRENIGESGSEEDDSVIDEDMEDYFDNF